jgi:transposase-like protein
MPSVFKKPYLQDEAAAFEVLEAIVWREGPVCPHCGCMGRIAPLKGVKDKKGRERLGLKKCYDCRKQFTVRKGTLFEDSPIPLHVWFQAAFLMCSSKKGVSSNQLHRTLGVTLQTAWFMSHRLREAMRAGDLPPMGGPGNVAITLPRDFSALKTPQSAPHGAVPYRSAFFLQGSNYINASQAGLGKDFILDKADSLFWAPALTL